MEWLFGRRLTPQEMLKENQRTISRAIREIERERNRLQRSEGKIIADIRKSARDGQMGAARVMAKDLVRTRKHVEKMYKMKTQLQAVSLRIQTIKSQAAMADAMRGVTRAMVRMNRTVNLPSLQNIMVEFQKQSEIMDIKEDMIGDTMDDMFDDDEEEMETDEVVNQVLDEIGIKLGSEFSDTPEHNIKAKKEATERVPIAAEVTADQELQNRLDNLRRVD
uniref:Charged multivesicular body protein 2a n=1 Tax=Arcella intermedia TaxID=1963864 RepID=A0A6B2LHH7_9EUKA